MSAKKEDFTATHNQELGFAANFCRIWGLQNESQLALIICVPVKSYSGSYFFTKQGDQILVKFQALNLLT